MNNGKTPLAVGDALGAVGGILPDSWIEHMARWHGMIEPFVANSQRSGVISYGLSSYGYDFRIADEFKVFHAGNGTERAVVDPKHIQDNTFLDRKGDVCILPPNSFALCRTVEYFRIPRDVITICLGKSTYARCGIIINVTPFEPGWEGYATIEISNSTPLPVKIYANEGVGQILFLQGVAPCSVTYADKKGKYQNQGARIVLPRIEE